MKGRLLQHVNYIGWVVIVLTIVVIYLSYFLIYIPNQKADLTQRAFRILKEYGNNMVGKHAYYETHFKNYGVYYLLKSLEKDQQIVPVDSTKPGYQKMHEVYGDLFDFVGIDSIYKFRNSSLIYLDAENKPFLYFNSQVPDRKSIRKIQSVYHFVKDKDPDTIANKVFGSMVYKVPVIKFMEGLKFDELFENITLFDRGKVYYNSNGENLPDITMPQPLCDSTDRAQGGVYQLLKIRGKEKHVMILPIDFHGKRIYIAGLINDTVYKTITQTFNTWLLMIVAGFLLLVFVAMPILKTMFIGPMERLKAFDVSGSGVSILFGSALFVLLIISIIKHQFVDRDEVAKRIEMISNSLLTNVTTEINAIKELGFAITKKDTSKLMAAISETYGTKPVTGIPYLRSVDYDSFVNNGKSQRNGTNLLKSRAKSEIAIDAINTFTKGTFVKKESLRYLFPLNEIILINSSGIVKSAYTRTAFSDAMEVNLSDRQYFKNIIEPGLAWVTSDNSAFFIESIKSYNTGYQETAISFDASKYGKKMVLAITSKIPSLYKQVLPADIQFVVIDKAGKVLYHSKNTKNLHENFIEECESNPGIQKAIQLKINDNVRIRYNETRWLARIVPIKETGLFHITLLDLNQTDRKNARIFLVTFFLTIGLQVFTIGSIVMFIFAFRNKNREPDFLRFVKWLSFYGPNYNIYKGMLIILSCIAAAGIWSFMSQTDVINVLLLQLLSVGLTFLTTLFFLNRKEFRPKYFFGIHYFPENLMLIVLVLMILFGFAKSAFDKTIIIPLLILLLTALLIPFIYKHFGNRQYNLAGASGKKSKLLYLLVLFLWLAIFSVIPVIHSYFSVKHFEEKLWQQQQLFKVANENLQLLKSDKNYHSGWFGRTKGDGIDGMKVTYITNNQYVKLVQGGAKTNSTISEKLYAWLPNPVENGFSHREFLAGKVQLTDWKLTGKSLFYPAEGNQGVIWVKAGDKIGKSVEYFMVVIVVFFLAAFCIWQLVQFAAKVFLNLDNKKTEITRFSWLDFLKEENNQRILLKSFNAELFLAETIKVFNNPKKETKKIEAIQAITLSRPDFSWEPFFKSSATIIWIYGINECIPEIEKHGELLDALTMLNQNHNKKIVVDLPFEIELIEEYYDEYVATDQANASEKAEIFKLRKRWKVIFEDYTVYNGYLSQAEFSEAEIRLSGEALKKYYSKLNPERNFVNIWKNLTNYEKIVLYDLADDGLINRNNRSSINQLTEKMLIRINPYPEFYLDTFREFVFQHITKEEIKNIEIKLGKKGNWRNAKYLILLIIIPMAAFIFISQGITIERSFGILGGIVTAIMSLLKLLEGNTVKSG